MADEYRHEIPLSVTTTPGDDNTTNHRITSRGQRHTITETSVKTSVKWSACTDPSDCPMPFEVTIRGFVWAPERGEDDA